MVKLNRRVPQPKATNNIFIPLLNTSTIWISRDLAPFADAPFCLYQCKHNEASNVQNIYWITEFDKYGLLITSNTGRSKTGWIVTTILMKVWQNKLKNYKGIDLSPKQNKQYLVTQKFYSMAKPHWTHNIMFMPIIEKLKKSGLLYILTNGKKSLF